MIYFTCSCAISLCQRSGLGGLHRRIIFFGAEKLHHSSCSLFAEFRLLFIKLFKYMLLHYYLYFLGFMNASVANLFPLEPAVQTLPIKFAQDTEIHTKAGQCCRGRAPTRITSSPACCCLRFKPEYPRYGSLRWLCSSSACTGAACQAAATVVKRPARLRQAVAPPATMLERMLLR